MNTDMVFEACEWKWNRNGTEVEMRWNGSGNEMEMKWK